MSIRKGLFPILLALGAMGSMQSAYADCKRDETVATINLNMDVGTVVVPHDAAVGSVIHSQTFTVNGATGVPYVCTNTERVTFNATLVNPGNLVGDRVYSTNIAGIGIRLKRGSGAINITYPDKYQTSAQNFILNGSQFTVELIKTSEMTGSGSVTPGLYSRYSGPTGSPLLETTVTLGGITIVSPSCEITSDRVMNIDMPEARIGDFTGMGSTVQPKSFGIDLKCSGGVNGAGRPNINVSFSGHIPGGLTDGDGVLANEYTGSDIAKGIGIQVVKDNRPVKFNDRYLVGELNTSGDVYMTIPLVASYYQYDANPTEGKVESNMVYNIDYD